MRSEALRSSSVISVSSDKSIFTLYENVPKAMAGEKPYCKRID